MTAIFEREYNIDTISWSLGSEVSYIEIDAKANVTVEQMAQVERLCNELIAAATPVHVHILGDLDQVDAPADVMRATRGLPKDHIGDIRVITIHGVESNMCCGTHVSNLAQLQCVKLLNVEKFKNRQFLHFLIGNRVMKRLQACFERECELTTILKYVRLHTKTFHQHFLLTFSFLPTEVGLHRMSNWLKRSRQVRSPISVWLPHV